MTHRTVSEYTTINAENERLIGRSLTDLERAAQDEWMAEMEQVRKGLNHFQVNDRVVQHRPETLVKQEQRALYGAWDPTKGTCSVCNMVLPKSGQCC